MNYKKKIIRSLRTQYAEVIKEQRRADQLDVWAEQMYAKAMNLNAPLWRTTYSGKVSRHLCREKTRINRRLGVRENYIIQTEKKLQQHVIDIVQTSPRNHMVIVERNTNTEFMEKRAPIIVSKEPSKSLRSCVKHSKSSSGKTVSFREETHEVSARTKLAEYAKYLWTVLITLLHTVPSL